MGKLKERINKIRTGQWHYSWSDAFWILWGWLWRFFVSCVLAVTGCFLFALLNDKLATIDSHIYGTWKWDMFAFMYFSVLVGAILHTWLSWYRK